MAFRIAGNGRISSDRLLNDTLDDSRRYWDELLELFADKSIRCPHEILDKTNTLS